MCLGVPGKILSIYDHNAIKMAEVDFNGITMKICLETTPTAQVGDYVIAHAGFAINLLEENDALETLRMLDEINKLGEEQLG